jgi:RNA polymerase sigma-70 factor (ECF subfamily)
MNGPLHLTTAGDGLWSGPMACGDEAPVVDVDAQFMARAATGDDGAFEQLVKRHQKNLLNYFVRMGAYAECEDLVQNTFVRLYQFRHRYQATAKFTTFLYTLAYRVWADLGRKNQRREKLSAHLRVVAESTETNADERCPHIDVEAALDQLSHKLRDVVVLHFYQGLPYQEIADVLRIPLGTVKSRMNLAIQALREQFHDASAQRSSER